MHVRSLMKKHKLDEEVDKKKMLFPVHPLYVMLCIQVRLIRDPRQKSYLQAKNGYMIIFIIRCMIKFCLAKNKSPGRD